MKRISEQQFKQIKGSIWRFYESPRLLAKKFDIHLSTVLNIKGCRNYEEYRDLVKAEHPPTKYSLADDVLELHRLQFDHNDNKYITPPTARAAMRQLLSHV